MNLFLSTNLITNFKPSFLQNSNNTEIYKKNKKQKYCKNFLIYILLFKYKIKIFKKSNIFIKKYKKNVYTILRSPYRHKLARHQFFLKRYFINFSVIINLAKPIYLNNFKKLNDLIIFIKKYNNFFESNLIFISNVNISLPIIYKNNFLIK